MCVPPNEIPYTNIIGVGAITDTWNVSIYIHIMEKILPHLIFEINHRKWSGGLPTSTTKRFVLICITYHLSMEYHGIYYTNTISNQISGNDWLHTTALYDNKSSRVCHQWHSRFCNAITPTWIPPFAQFKKNK